MIRLACLHFIYTKEVTKEMEANTLYMKEIVNELKRLTFDAIKEIHDSEADGTNLPELSLSGQVIDEIASKWNELVVPPKRGIYKSYVEQTITRYAQNRQHWKAKFGLENDI